VEGVFESWDPLDPLEDVEGEDGEEGESDWVERVCVEVEDAGLGS
jgi:hypothetical protein